MAGVIIVLSLCRLSHEVAGWLGAASIGDSPAPCPMELGKCPALQALLAVVDVLVDGERVARNGCGDVGVAGPRSGETPPDLLLVNHKDAEDWADDLESMDRPADGLAAFTHDHLHGRCRQTLQHASLAAENPHPVGRVRTGI